MALLKMESTSTSNVVLYDTVPELSDLLAGRNEDLNLDVAALQLARVEFPGLEIAPFVAVLDSYAVELSERLGEAPNGPQYVAAANRYIFEELGFRGNQTDYYNPHNSCLNQVLVSRLGIPITLSIVYLEIGRRLAKPVHGIGLPGHFLVEYNDGEFSTYLDPFDSGKLLPAAECYELARRITGVDVSEDPSILAPVGKRHILLRMLNNLRGIYLRSQAWRKVTEVLDLLIAAEPDSAEQHKQRAFLHLQLHRFKAAKTDLEKYLMLAPDAADRAEVEQQLRSIQHRLAQLN